MIDAIVGADLVSGLPISAEQTSQIRREDVGTAGPSCVRTQNVMDSAVYPLIVKLLEDITVLDATQVWAGPLASMHLGDLGAEVIKVEKPDTGDHVRHVPPFVDGMSGYFATVNRNKDSITLNLAADRGREIFLDLAREADVVIENQKPGAAEKLGIDYESVRAVNPEIIYCSIKGFAQDSQYAEHPAYDIVIQAMGGAMSITGEKGGDPLPSKVPIGDISAGMFASQSILAALYARDLNDAGGTYIEVPMLNTMVAFLGARATSSLIKGEPYPRLGSEHTDYVPYKCFATRDSYLVLAVGSETDWVKYCKAIGHEDLLEDARFESLESRLENKDQLYQILDPIMAAKPTDEWLALLQDRGIPCGPVYDTLEIWEDSYADQQALLEHLTNDGLERSIPVVRYPSNFSDGDATARAGPPQLGAQTEERLRALGYSREDITELKENNII